jgi:hypothetical protein
MRRADLIALSQSIGFPRVSLYFPTHLSYPSIEQDPIRLSTALKEAEHQLVAAGMRRPEIESLLAEAKGRLPATMFWRYQEKGLAVLIEPGTTHWIKLPEPVAETVVVSSRYHLTPMIPMFRNGDQFHVLAVTRDSVRLLDGRAREMRETSVDGMPSGIAEIMAFTEFQNDLGFHARDRGGPQNGGDSAKYHALGISPDDYDGIELDNYLLEVGKAVDRHLVRSEAPLVLAAKARILGRLRKHISYRHVADAAIQTDPVALGDEALHAEAWSIAEPLVRADRESARARLRARVNGAEVTCAKELQSLLRSAIEGRIENIFLARDATCWGHYDEAHQVLRLDPKPSRDNEDVLNRLAMETLQRGGDVFTLPDDMREKAGLAAALFRY